MEKEFKQFLQDRFDAAKEVEKARITPFLQKEWEGFSPAMTNAFEHKTNTKVAIEDLKRVAKNLYQLSENDKLFKKNQRILNDQRKMIEETNKIDWGMAELLAYGSLLDEGNSIRLSGQDVERGTFSHRHAILKLEESEKEVCPLNSVSKTAKFEAYNSLLSEYGVLGFDYGYSMARPNSLTIWEAQFGDFSNGGQIMLDQFISCAEDKWRIMNGLVMLLPHGYEGQGAEHSSARLERYLQMCAQDNMQITNCTTPANFFHVLRRQIKRDFRKPLIVFTPKSLLRHPKCISSLEELSDGTFRELIDDPTAKADSVEKLVFCSGKIYYELESVKQEKNQEDVAIVRLEQLYPLPASQIEEILKKYNAKRIMWVQEEPANMGAWSHIMRNFRHIPFEVVSRSESAATASGSSKHSFQRQNIIIEKVFK
jgi:2-oxoglutarate dehydrogenase E1 component